MAKTFAYNSVFNAISSVSTTLGGFASTVLVARLLGVEGTGVVAFAAWIVTVVSAAADIGIPGALARHLPILRAANDEGAVSALTKYLLSRFLISLAIVGLCFVVYSMATAWMHPHQHTIEATTYREAWTFWTFVGAACVTQGLASFTNGYLRGKEAFGLLARLAVLGAALQIVTTLVGTWMFGIAGAMAGAIAGAIVPATVVFTINRQKGTVQPALKQSVSRFAWETWASYLITAFAWSRMEIFFLERSWGPDAAGVFSVSFTLANVAAQMPLLLTGALLPPLARHAASDVSKAHYGYSVAVRLMSAIVFPACFGMAAIAPKLMPWLFGAEFAQAVPIAIVLLAAAAFSATSAVATIFLFAMNRTRIVLVVGAAGALMSVVVGLLAVPVYGAEAAAAGRGVIQIMTIALLVWYIQARLNCATPLRAMGLLLACAILCGLAAFTTLQIVPGLPAIPAAIAVGVIVYALALKLLRPLPAGDFDRVQEFADILPTPLRRAAQAVTDVLRP